MMDTEEIEEKSNDKSRSAPSFRQKETKSKSMSPKEKIFIYLRKSFYTGAFKTAVVAAVNLMFLPLIIQQVGMEKYGMISLVMIFGNLMVFADFGIAKSVVLLIGKDNSQANVVASNSLAVILLILALVGSLLSVVEFFEIPVLGEGRQHNQVPTGYILLAGYIVLATMLINNLLIAILESYLLIHYVNVGHALSAVSINIVIYITSIVSRSLDILIFSPVFSLLLVLVYFSWVVFSRTDIRGVMPTGREMKRITHTSVQFFNIGLVHSLVIPVNKYLLVYLSGSSSALGVFDVAMKISLTANSLLSSITIPLMGVFSNMAYKKKEILKIASKVSAIVLFMYCIGCALYYIIGDYLTHFIDADNGDQLFWVSMLLLIGVCSASLAEPFFKALLSMEKLQAAFRLKLLIPLVNLILIAFLFSFSSLSSLESITFSYSCAMVVSSLAINIYAPLTIRSSLVK